MEQKLVLMGNGKRVILPMDEVLSKLGLNPEDFWGLGFRVENDGMALESYTTGDFAYPAITIDGYDKQNRLYYLSTSELPNEDHPDMNTYLYSGETNSESDDWIARVDHGLRDENDDSRHVIYVDRRLAVTCDATRTSDFITEKQLNEWRAYR